jgi:phosphoglucomutase
MHNRGKRGGSADGIVLTPSHNPPEDGGIKYNPPHGGPAGSEVTSWIEEQANDLLEHGADSVRRTPFERAVRATTTHPYDYVSSYVDDLPAVVDLAAIRGAGLRLGVDPLGGSSVAFWRRIAARYRLELTIVNDRIDPIFRFIPLDHAGRIRMDCSSPHAMARLTDLRHWFDVAVANDPDQTGTAS